MSANIHGTYAGWNKHKQTDTEPCRACKDAAAAYMRQYRLATGRTKSRLVRVSPAELTVLRLGSKAEMRDQWPRSGGTDEQLREITR